MNSIDAPINVLIASGGTGGHIWPAISFSDWIEENQPDSNITFVCGNRSIENEIFSFAGQEPIILPIEGSPLSGSLRTRLIRWKDILFSIGKSIRILKDWGPDVCVVFGGYVSFPVIVASILTRTPVILHEQNARAGLVTRICSKLRIPVYSGWERCSPLPDNKYIHVGIPVRKMTRTSPEEAWKKLGFGMDLPDSPRVVVLGGSLGSDPLRDLFYESCSLAQFADLNIILVTPERSPEQIAPNLWFAPRNWDIGLLYSLADVIVARAGASTLAELVVFNKPSVIIPWRRASDDHQYENSKIFHEQGHGSIWEINNGILETLGFMIDYEYKRARFGRNLSCPESRNDDACKKLWISVSQHTEGRGRN